MSRDCHNNSFWDKFLLILVLKTSDNVMTWSIPWWYQNRSWSRRARFHVGHFCPLKSSGQETYMELTLRINETWNLILNIYKKEVPKSSQPHQNYDTLYILDGAPNISIGNEWFEYTMWILLIVGVSMWVLGANVKWMTSLHMLVGLGIDCLPIVWDMLKSLSSFAND